MVGDGTCGRCGKLLPPYGAGVPTSEAEYYCWGHVAEDAEAPHVARWAALRARLDERLAMARPVLDEAGHHGVAVLVPVEEMLIWMDELA
jgi:hypothetical protein